MASHTPQNRRTATQPKVFLRVWAAFWVAAAVPCVMARCSRDPRPRHLNRVFASVSEQRPAGSLPRGSVRHLHSHDLQPKAQRCTCPPRRGRNRRRRAPRAYPAASATCRKLPRAAVRTGRTLPQHTNSRGENTETNPSDEHDSAPKRGDAPDRRIWLWKMISQARSTSALGSSGLGTQKHKIKAETRAASGVTKRTEVIPQVLGLEIC